MKKLVAVAIGLGCWFASAPRGALAEPIASDASVGLEDEVTLKDGGAVRGVVISTEPGKEVKILVPGEKAPRVLPWSQVADVQRGKFAAKKSVEAGAAGEGYGDAPAKKATASAKPTHASDDRPRSSGTVRVHIESPEPTELKHVVATGQGEIAGHSFAFSSAETVCRAPCDEEIPIDSAGDYYVDGSFPKSGTFTIPSDGQDAVVEVKPGSTVQRVFGWISLGLAPTLVGGGTVFLITGTPDCTLGCSQEEADDTTPAVVGGTLIGAGVAAAIAGVVLIATSGTTATARAADAPAVGLWVGAPKEVGRSVAPAATSTVPSVVGVQGAF